jgi:hypothetical protein
MSDGVGFDEKLGVTYDGHGINNVTGNLKMSILNL